MVGQRSGQDKQRVTHQASIHVEEGLKQPEVPMQAAKFASKGGIIMCGHIPILTRWKDYKADDEKQLKIYIGKLVEQFNIDTTSQLVIEACTDMLKSQERQGRYQLKKKYFEDLAANEVPTKTPVTTINDDYQPHRERFTINIDNHEAIRYPQHTESRSYVAQAHAVTTVEAVAAVVQSRIFREVAGIHPPIKKRTRVGTILQVEEIQADIESEKQGGAQLRQKIAEQEIARSFEKQHKVVTLSDF
uniref:Uncharacterized protein n=1 Tax=Setaria italica TaxID=4555 RepID=K4A184_SETIT